MGTKLKAPSAPELIPAEFDSEGHCVNRGGIRDHNCAEIDKYLDAMLKLVMEANSIANQQST